LNLKLIDLELMLLFEIVLNNISSVFLLISEFTYLKHLSISDLA
jgi:hypothetical protein